MKHKFPDAQITLGGRCTLGGTHTAHHSHSKSLSVFIKLKYFGSVEMKPQELGSRRQQFPSRPGHQARAQPNLCSMSLQAKAEPGAGVSLSLLVPVPLGHPLVEKPDISRNQKGQGVQKQKGQCQSRRAMSGQDHSRCPASYEMSEFVVLKRKYKLLNVNTS